MIIWMMFLAWWLKNKPENKYKLQTELCGSECNPEYLKRALAGCIALCFFFFLKVWFCI